MVNNIIFNDVWDIDIAFEMTLLAIASFSIVYASISYMGNRLREALVGGLISTILPIGALIILYSHLLKPEIAHLIFLSFQTRSWMLYGASGVSLLILLSLLFSISIKLGVNKSITKILGLLAAAIGVFVSIYPGITAFLRERNTFLEWKCSSNILITNGIGRRIIGLYDSEAIR